MPRGSAESLAGRLHDEWSSRYGTDANWESSFARSIIWSPWCEGADRWSGNITFILANLPRIVSVDFEGDTAHVEILNAIVSSGVDVGQKDEVILYAFDQNLSELDGPPYGGPSPWDIGVMIPVRGALLCPGNYPLRFVIPFAPLNSGEVETDGWLSISFTVELDP